MSAWPGISFQLLLYAGLHGTQATAASCLSLWVPVRAAGEGDT